MRSYTNARGSGKVFSVDLADDSVRSRFIPCVRLSNSAR